MPDDDFTTHKNFQFRAKHAKIESSNIDADDPEVNRVAFITDDPDVPSGRVTVKPRKTIQVEKNVNGVDAFGEKSVKYRVSELPDGLMDVIQDLQDGVELSVTATVSSTYNSGQDQRYHFIRGSDLDTLSSTEVPESTKVESPNK